MDGAVLLRSGFANALLICDGDAIGEELVEAAVIFD